MHNLATLILRILRGGIGIVLMLIATAFLIDGGLSRYAKYGIPPHADWRLIAIGLAIGAIGGFLIRPFWWRRLSRH
jgi:hypothetical protein